MFVKVCGITRREDALAAVESGAGAVGFIFHPLSPRYVPPRAVGEWIEDLPADIWRVGVFVDQTPAAVERICADLHLDVAQLHGSERAADVPAAVRVWKAFRVHGALDLAVEEFPAEAVLLDGARSGEPFDWRLARGVRRRVILAGGLNEHNVAAAIEEALPWGVDACSCLESSPGKKDHARMARFLKACQPLLAIPQ